MSRLFMFMFWQVYVCSVFLFCVLLMVVQVSSVSLCGGVCLRYPLLIYEFGVGLSVIVRGALIVYE